MDDDVFETLRCNESTSSKTIAVNASFAAIQDTHGIHVQEISRRHQSPRTIIFHPLRSFSVAIAAFSTSPSELLVIADGAQVWVYDVSVAKHISSIKGNGRTVTSICLSNGDRNVIAIGAIDGSIRGWSLSEPSKLFWQSTGIGQPCSHVTFNPARDEILAASHEDSVCILERGTVLRRYNIGSGSNDVVCLCWTGDDESSLLAISSDGSYMIVHAKSILRESASSPAPVMEEEKHLNQSVDSIRSAGVQEPLPLRAHLGFKLKHVKAVDSCNFLMLNSSCDKISAYTLTECEELAEKWSIPTAAQVDTFTIRSHDASTELLICCNGLITTLDVPTTARSSIYPPSGDSSTQSIHDKRRFARPTNLATASMMPERLWCGSPEPKHDVRMKKHGSVLLGKSHHRHAHGRAGQSSELRFEAKPVRSMTSSLELPSNDEIDAASPMPFLSPTIPARRSPSRAITPLDESLNLPPLARASFDSIQSSTANDSDSDDEAFPGDATVAAGLLPKGVNVPLPRTCGARFSVNGALLTFFPSNPKPPSIVEEHDNLAGDNVDKEDFELARLFPAFGNMKIVRLASKFLPESPQKLQRQHSNPGSKVAQQLSSFESRSSWRIRSSPTKTGMPLQPHPRVEIRVRDENLLLQSQKSLVLTYRTRCYEGEFPSDICLANATSAVTNGMKAVAEFWTTMASFLEITHMSSSAMSAGDAVRVRGKRGGSGQWTASQLKSGRILSFSAGFPAPSRAIWANHPFGREWGIPMLLRWVEDRADLQLLASVSALLLAQTGTIFDDYSARDHVTPSVTLETSSRTSSIVRIGMSYPHLSTYSGRQSYFEESPTKPMVTSRTSSRNPSLPTTPYMDSLGSTPPSAFAALARQGSRLSTSGSASPKHHRSSFSAAARSYAQSITDRFATYGSSPPFKRAGTSPNNELSSSLPIGSWSKSVSFASNTDTAKESRRGSVLAHDIDGYSSDQTVDDADPISTPKNSDGDIPIKLKNQGSFFDEITPAGMTSSTLLSPELEMKCGIWCNAYAEILRSWDFLIEAAEFEKMSCKSPRDPPRAQKSEYSVAPRTKPGQNFPTCSICNAVIYAAEHLCPVCLHAAHLPCLETVVLATSVSDSLCIVGCGCECTHTFLGESQGAGITSTAPLTAVSDDNLLEHYGLDRPRNSLGADYRVELWS